MNIPSSRPFASRAAALRAVTITAAVASAMIAGPAQVADASPILATAVHDANIRQIAPAITPATLPTAIIGVPYAQSIAASGDGALQFTTTDPLPPGLTLFASGSIVGTPTATGASSFTFRVTVASAEGVASARITVPVRAAVAPNIDSVTLPAVTVGSFYSQKVVATGDGPLTFETLDPLPPGLAISSTGTVFGDPTMTTMSSYAVRVRVTSVLAMANATAVITIPIANPSSVPVITSSTPTAAIAGTPYSFQLSATGAPAPTFSVVGTLPAWLRLDTVTGILSGTPAVADSYNFSVVATNPAGASAPSALTIIVAAAPAPPVTPPIGTGGTGATTPTSTTGVTASTGDTTLGRTTTGTRTSQLAETGVDEAARISAGATSFLLLGGGLLGLLLQRRRRRSAD